MTIESKVVKQLVKTHQTDEGAYIVCKETGQFHVGKNSNRQNSLDIMKVTIKKNECLYYTKQARDVGITTLIGVYEFVWQGKFIEFHDFSLTDDKFYVMYV